MEAHKEYQFYMDRYMETWPQMKEIVHKTVDHNNKKQYYINIVNN